MNSCAAMTITTPTPPSPAAGFALRGREFQSIPPLQDALSTPGGRGSFSISPSSSGEMFQLQNREIFMRTRRNEKLQNYARKLRHDMTDAERCLWQKIRGRQLGNIKFRRQYVIGNYIADFAAPEIHLIIELDGGQHTERQLYDQQRSLFLQSQGYRVLRFWNHDVLQRTDAVLAEILKHCDI